MRRPSVLTTAMRWLSAAERALERAGWSDLFTVAAAMVLVGVLSALAGAYSVGFVAVCAVFGFIAYRNSAAACVLVALTSPVVALGSVDVGFHLIPAYVFVAAGVLGVLRRGELRQVRWGLPDALLAAFLAVAVVVTLANVGRVPGTTVVAATGTNGHGVRWLTQGVALMGMGGLYLLIRTGVRSEAHLAAVVRALLVATACVGGYALYQIVGRELSLPYTSVNERRPADSLPTFRYIRVNATLTEASPLGQFAAVALCLGAAWVAAGIRPQPWLSRRLAVIVGVGGAGLVVATLSKSAALACLIWLPLVVLTVPNGRRRRELVLAGVGILAGVAIAWPFLSEPVANLSGQRGVSSERYVRVGYWTAAIDIARDHPFGVGVGNYSFYFPLYASLSGTYEYALGTTDAHNLVLEAIAETGALGGALFVLFGVALVVTPLRAAWRRRDPFLAATAWGLAGAFVIGATMHLTYSYFYFPFEWVLAGLLATLPSLLDRGA